jgi:carboxypeptidase Q
MRRLALMLLMSLSFFSSAQDKEAAVKKIYDYTLDSGRAYTDLRVLCKQIGGRLSGSPAAAAAVEFTRQKMLDYGFDSVWLQEVMVPRWQRGQVCNVLVSSTKLGSMSLKACALGGSIGTGPTGISAKVIEVKSLEHLNALGQAKIKGSIVFFNGAFDSKEISTFSAYGKAVGQRWGGAMEAAKFGAVAVLVRSMSSEVDDLPHTGSMGYDSATKKIPAASISTLAAEQLSKNLGLDPALNVYLEMDCGLAGEVLSYNVVGELFGRKPDAPVIVVGGHLDSWDLGEGAHDDGTGCIQSIEAIRVLKAIGYKPNHRLRAVMFMNEENGLRGGKKYAELAQMNNEKHRFALESDRGGFTPRGFSFDVRNATEMAQFNGMRQFFSPYGADWFTLGGGGSDIAPLKANGTICLGFVPDSQRYFKYHHAASDTFEAVDSRELSLGAAAMAAMIYLLDQL